MLSIRKAHSNSSWLIDLCFLAILLGVFYAIWIGGHALFTPDEGRYSEVAREMVVTGDYVTPRLNGVAFLDKPILYYWLQASAIKLFGVKEAALRFWPALIGVLGCLMTYLTGRVLFNRRTGLLSAIILATSPVYYGAAHYANLDLEVAVLISITLLFSVLALHSEGKNRVFLLMGAYVFCGLAALTKGLIGLAFPALIIGLWIFILNRWQTLKHLRLITGLIIFSVITVPWYYLVQQANPEFMHFFFVTQQFSRFLTQGHYNNQAAVWFYIPIVLVGCFPWCLFAIQALTKTIKSTWKSTQAHSKELFILLWFTVIFIFFSIPKSKTIGYIIPVFPALALMIGHYLNDLSSKTAGFKAGLIAFILFSIATTTLCVTLLTIKTLHIPNEAIPYLILTACIFFIASLVSYKLLKTGTVTQIIYCIAVTAGLSLLTLSASSDLLNKKSIKPIALQLGPKLTPADEVVTFYKYYQDLPVYLQRRITIVADWHAPDIAKKDNWVRELWYGMPFQNTSDWLINEEAFWQRWNSDKRLYVFMDVNSFPQFAEKAKNSIQQSGSNGKTVWVSNKV